eukprot:scaffold294_cov221-Amphora_coffeaeformis.AAC.48
MPFQIPIDAVKGRAKMFFPCRIPFLGRAMGIQMGSIPTSKGLQVTQRVGVNVVGIIILAIAMFELVVPRQGGATETTKQNHSNIRPSYKQSRVCRARGGSSFSSSSSSSYCRLTPKKQTEPSRLVVVTATATETATAKITAIDTGQDLSVDVEWSFLTSWLTV